MLKVIKEDLPKIDTDNEFSVGDVKVQSGVESTITNIDKETGGITWDIVYLPNFEELFEDASDLVTTAKGVYQKTKARARVFIIKGGRDQSRLITTDQVS